MSSLNRLQLLRERYFTLKDIKKTFTLLRPFIQERRGAYSVLFIILLVEIVLSIVYATYFGRIADAAVRANFNEVRSLIPFGLMLLSISFLITFVEAYYETIATSGVKKNLKNFLFHKFLRLPVGRQANMRTGEWITYFTNDIHNLDGVIGYGLLNLIRIPILFVIVFFYLLQINLTMTLLALCIAPIALVAGAVFGLLIRRNSRLLNELFEKVNSRLTESFQGMAVIRSFTLEHETYQHLDKETNDFYQVELKNAKLRGWFSAGSQVFGSIAYLVSIFVGAYYVSVGRLTVGSLLTFLSLVGYLVDPLTNLAKQWANFQKSVTAVERLLLISEEPTVADELPQYKEASVLFKGIQVKQLSFSYDVSQPVFSNLNLTIPAGKTVALVGPSGAGKSTFLNLLQGYYQPQTGDILFDQKSIGNMSVSELRSSIASVPQETFLFAGTIKENLMLARPSITNEEMIQAAKEACIHDFIVSLPEGYDTSIGERGIKLSGGQKQRIAIARAILKNAPILLLDEATSALDTETEYYVQEALEHLKTDRTTITIAHRLSTIEHADIIVVLDKGNIVQMGTHEELVSVPGLYRQLYQTKFKTNKRLLA